MLPDPRGWRSGQRKVVWAAIGLLAISAWVVYRGIEATMRGHYLTTAVVIGWVSPILFALVALARSTQGPTALRAKFDSAGTTLRPDIWMSVLLLAGALVFIPGAVLFVIFVPRGGIDLPMSRGMQIFSPILMASALFIVITGLIMAWRRGGVGYVRLRPAGLDNANIAFTKSVVWEDIVAIKAQAEGKKTRKAVVLVMRGGSEEIVEGLDWYVPNGAPLYWMVRHYWRHPDDRVELTDGRALDRLREGLFDVEQ